MRMRIMKDEGLREKRDSEKYTSRKDAKSCGAS